MVRLVGEQQEVFETAVGQNLRPFPAHRDTPRNEQTTSGI
jgi:hypothetical protein